jgi:hypothetical protein
MPQLSNILLGFAHAHLVSMSLSITYKLKFANWDLVLNKKLDYKDWCNSFLDMFLHPPFAMNLRSLKTWTSQLIKMVKKISFGFQSKFYITT